MTTEQGLELKIKIIDDYIHKIDQIVSEDDDVAAEELQSEIHGVYCHEIRRFDSQLDSNIGLKTNYTVDYIGNLKKIKAKLANYKTNLLSGIYSKTSESNVSVNQSVVQEVSSTITITLESTVSSINHLPDNVLSDEQKEMLNGKLASISAETVKEKRWEKVKNTLKWIAEKGIEVGEIALPYIVQAINNG